MAFKKNHISDLWARAGEFELQASDPCKFIYLSILFLDSKALKA